MVEPFKLCMGYKHQGVNHALLQPTLGNPRYATSSNKNEPDIQSIIGFKSVTVCLYHISWHLSKSSGHPGFFWHITLMTPKFTFNLGAHSTSLSNKIPHVITRISS